MTNPDLTHIYFLLDRSGSMQSIKADTEGGFDAFIAEQRTTGGTCRVTLAQFDTDYDIVYAARPIADVPRLDLQPRGMTALLDSMGRLITDTGRELAGLPEAERPDTVLVGIMTDGEENSSQEWSHAAIKALVEQQTRDYGWQFLYLGADQDAIEVGASVGIAPGQSLTYGRGQVAPAMAAMSANVSAYRKARSAGHSADDAAAALVFTEKQRKSSAR
ncbi:MAG TPA: VWA domain-containing protein [Dermatophilaceae bacterium]|nr:VWA domain-containing protein [Dermatophilaceae bacterium]